MQNTAGVVILDPKHSYACDVVPYLKQEGALDCRQRTMRPQDTSQIGVCKEGHDGSPAESSECNMTAGLDTERVYQLDSAEDGRQNCFDT